MDQVVKFEFVRAPGVTVSNVNGYWVYPTGSGRLLLDFYYQHPLRTESVSYQLDQSGLMGKEVDRNTSPAALREIMASIDITPQLAAELGQYLLDTAQSMGVTMPQSQQLNVTKQ